MKTYQSGIAVISAMLLAALTTVIVAQTIWQQQLLMSELENQLNASQAQWMTDAAIQWARPILAEDNKTNAIDHHQELWATRLPSTKIEGGKISGQIIDMQQFFNLNNVKNENSSQQALSRLLNKLSLNETLMPALMDWLDEDDIANGAEGVESNYYSEQTPAYLAANQALVEMGNLIRVKDFDAETVNKLRPFVTVLPKNTELNVNTASAEVLSFVLPEINLQEAQSLVAYRNVTPFLSIADFRERMPDQEVDIGNINLSVNSRYFLVTCIAQIDRTSVRVEALLYRDDTGWPVVIWKRIG